MLTAITYERGSAELRVLRAAIEAEWRNVLAEPETSRRLQEVNVTVGDIPTVDVMDIRAGSSGFDVSGADVIIAIGGWATGVLGEAAKEILLDIWREQVKPRVFERLGDDAIGPEKD